MTPEQHKLVLDNQELVHYIFKKRIYLTDQVRSWKEDLIQSGYLGLCKAAISYNGNSLFSTYASRCIENEMLMLLRSIQDDFMVGSIDAPIDEDGNCLLDIIPLDLDIEEEIVHRQELHYIVNIMNCADERTQKIIYCKLNDINWKNLPEFKNTKKQVVDRLYHKFIDKSRLILKFLKTHPDYPIKDLYGKRSKFFTEK